MAYWLTQLPKNILIFASAKDRNSTFTAGSFLHEVRISNFRRRHHSIPPKNDCIQLFIGFALNKKNKYFSMTKSYFINTIMAKIFSKIYL